jgi:hypothetical protein
MPYQEYPDGLYLASQRSAQKAGRSIRDHRHWKPARDCRRRRINPVVVHQLPPTIKADWLQNTGTWRILGKITDEPYAIARFRAAMANPRYDLFGHNCEHFARFVASGVRESRQLQAAGLSVALAALVISVATHE